MKINSKEERYKFLKANINSKAMGSYALVTYNNKTYPIWITAFWNWDKDGDWFLEAPCELRRSEFTDTSDKTIKKYAKSRYYRKSLKFGIEYTKSMIRDGWLYDIDSPQVSPFLPEKLEDLTLISEQYCLDWMIENFKLG
jgi:hypothetical protein